MLVGVVTRVVRSLEWRLVARKSVKRAVTAHSLCAIHHRAQTRRVKDSGSHFSEWFLLIHRVFSIILPYIAMVLRSQP